MHDFKNKLLKRKLDLIKLLTEIKLSGKTVVGYGSPAKVTTLVHYMGIGDMIDYIVDDSPLKIGRYTPGTHIPIYSPDKLYKDKPDYVIILAWNFAEPIMKKLHFNGFRGKCIIP